MATPADEVLAATVAGLPSSEHGYLLAGDVAHVPVSFPRVEDADWLSGQIDAQACRWPNVERRVLATLWWYSVSQVFLTPSLASYFVTGRALSPRLHDVQLHLFPDGTILTARSTAVLDGSDVIASLAGTLRGTLQVAISAVAQAGGTRELPLWALATDSLANRLLWVGRGRHEVARACALAGTLIELIGEPMPAPRFVDVDRRRPRGGRVRFVRRASCCLVYLEPGTAKCASCPRLAPAIRVSRLSRAADAI